ncbi:MAG: hypothetical protein EOM54_10600 [Clostridia bacterium]|nr:hypothetical protein [Clostridia bacterium]
MLIISSMLLVSVLIYATTAWFTKMVSVSGMEFSVAQWDFTANQTLDDMTINVYEYASLNGHLAAPGTAGYIPVLLSATHSDTDVVYYITVDESSMSQEFQDRIFFYYIDSGGVQRIFENDGNDMTGVIAHGTSTTITIYWEWIYELEFHVPEGQELTEEQRQAIEDHNEFDTRVGQNPSLYASYMNATVRIAGVQAQPG